MYKLLNSLRNKNELNNKKILFCDNDVCSLSNRFVNCHITVGIDMNFNVLNKVFCGRWIL